MKSKQVLKINVQILCVRGLFPTPFFKKKKQPTKSPQKISFKNFHSMVLKLQNSQSVNIVNVPC